MFIWSERVRKKKDLNFKLYFKRNTFILFIAVPIGLPPPTMPPINLLWLVAVDAIAISIVSYSVTISMAMIFAKKQSYDVKANQEMLALVRNICFKYFPTYLNDFLTLLLV